MSNDISGNGRLTGVFAQTNEADANRVVAFRRGADGALSSPAVYETGRRGDGVPHLTSQASVVLTGDGARLLVTNAGSGELSVFAVEAGGNGHSEICWAVVTKDGRYVFTTKLRGRLSRGTRSDPTEASRWRTPLREAQSRGRRASATRR
jgi:DNA-binding beta-propeller fold protein YncE